MRKLARVFKAKAEKCIYGAHIFSPSYTTPIQPCRNKANTLFRPYVLLKRALFDLKLIGQAWAKGLKAGTAGLSTAAREMVEVAAEFFPHLSSLLLPVFICPSPEFSQSLSTFIHALLLPFSTSPNLLASENWGALSSACGGLYTMTLVVAQADN